MTKLQELSIEKMKGAYATAHVWTNNRPNATPLSRKVLDAIHDLQNDGYLGEPQIQYSTTYDSNEREVIFSAFIIIKKN